jgi:hypothetical protein
MTEGPNAAYGTYIPDGNDKIKTNWQPYTHTSPQQ